MDESFKPLADPSLFQICHEIQWVGALENGVRKEPIELGINAAGSVNIIWVGRINWVSNGEV